MILVVGGTGILGGIIVHRLLAEGKAVRVLLRHTSPAEVMAKDNMATSPKSLIDAGAEPAYGDLKQPESLQEACKGVDVVITTANSAMRGGADTVDSVDRQGNRNLIEAAKKAGVKQFIFTSFLGASPNNPMPLFQAKAEIEAMLVADGLPYTILSPNFFMESWIGMVVGIPVKAQQPITLVGEGKRHHSLISIGDVAAFAATAVGHPEAINQKLILGGPEPLTWCGIVQAFENAIGHELPVNFVGMEEVIPSVPDIVSPVLTAMETYDSPIPMAETAKTFGVQLTPLNVVVNNMLGMPRS